MTKKLSPTAKDYLRSALPSAKQQLIGLGFGVLSSGSAIALLATSAWLITRAAEMPPLMYLSAAIVAVRAFAVGRAFFRYLERLQNHDSAFRALANLRVRAYRRLIPLAPDGLGSLGRGEVLNRMVRDIDSLQDLSLRVVQPVVVSGVLAVISAIVLAVFSPLAGASLFVMLVIAALAGYWVNVSLATKADEKLSSLRAKLADQLLEFVTRLDVLKVFGASGTKIAEILDTDTKLQQAEKRQALTVGIVTAVVSFTAGLASVLAIWFGYPMLLSGEIDGPFFALTVLAPMAVFEVFAQVPQAWGVWRQVRISAERLAETVPDKVPPELPNDTATDQAEAQARLFSGVESSKQPGSEAELIRLSQVAASWPGAQTNVLSNVDLVVKPGERILISGSSGAGKTALAHILVRFLEYQGSYQIRRVEAKALGGDSVRKIVGLVEQQPYLFDNSVRHNLNFANPEATEEDIWRVLEQVDLADWVRVRGGLDTELGEHGELASGGQAQRLGLARALLADFPILILDEPTANVQPELSENLIRQLMQAASAQNRAVLIISHTPVPSDLVDRSVVISAGTLKII